MYNITAYKYDTRGNRVVKITQDSDGNADATFSVYDKTNKLLYENNGEEVTTVYTYMLLIMILGG